LMKGRRALFVCDRTALINQTSERADAYGLSNHGIVQANHPRRDNSLPFQIASIQTLAARGYWPDADVVIIDECHTCYASSTEYIAKTKAAVIGLTATPCTKGLGLIYHNVVNAATPHELTQAGVLVPLNILSCEQPNMAGAKTTSTGEWTEKAAEERELEIVGDVVAEWLKYGENRKTIGFGATIAYCEELCRRFNAQGVNADLWTSETSHEDRENILKEFKKPDSRIRILLSVDALAKGFDVQDVGCIIDARPLRKSFSTAVQMWGRALRASPETNKKDALLLDFSGNIRRFQDEFEDIYFNGFTSLDDSEKLDATPRNERDWDTKGCPKCSHTPFNKRCMACGYEKIKQSTVEEAPGTMRPVMIGKKKLADNERDLYAQLWNYARKYIKLESQKGWVWYKYQDILGKKPPGYWNHATVPNVEVTRATAAKLKQLHIAYKKGHKA